MAKKDTRNLNVTIMNEQDDKDEVVISISAIFRNLKRYFLPWIIIAAMLGVLLLGVGVVKNVKSKPPITALVGFTYDGIEKGHDPAGRTFDANTLKNTTVIEDALSELDIDVEKLEDIRKNITIEGIVPSDAIDRITAYKSVMDIAVNGSLGAAQAVLDVTYYPTQFLVHFDYGAAGFDTDDGVQILNTMLEKYRDYFYNKYGYNKLLGASVKAIKYENYDYTEAVDLFRSNLNTLEKYVRQLSSDDNARFRANSTGYTFNDLYQAIRTVETIDLDVLSSKITINNITKDKQTAINYYAYRMENLQRSQVRLSEVLASVNSSIEAYEKDTIVMMQGTDGTPATLSEASDEYDKLIERKHNVTAELAEAKQDYAYCESRKKALETSTTATEAIMKELDQSFHDLNDKIQELVDITNETADEYFETVEFANAYNILVPSSNSKATTVVSIIKSILIPFIILEGLAFVIYFCIAFVNAVKQESKKKKAYAAASCGGDDDDDEDDDDDDDDIVEEVVEAVAEKAPSRPKQSSSKKNRKK